VASETVTRGENANALTTMNGLTTTAALLVVMRHNKHTSRSSLFALMSTEARKVHAAPPGVDYAANPTVFGNILRGEMSASPYLESDNLFSFRDRSPRAPVHALVIPKHHISSVNDLNPATDVDLVSSMRNMGLEIIRANEPDALERGDYVMCFQVPPFNTVNHLHLHVLAPASNMTMLARFVYKVETLWCASVDSIIDRMRDAVP
jgi:diadenosine tetraphosphate (Ap4A) HIT family hydrolase